MKLLLTSNGLSNQSIAKALFELVDKKPEETSVAFIPTAMNLSRGDKSWFINDLYNIKKQNFKFIDIVDIASLPKEVWLPRIENADILFFSGGNTSYLIYWFEKSGLKDILLELLKTKVYAGISAGSIVTNPNLSFSSKDLKDYFEENFDKTNDNGLKLVDLFVRPHYNTSKPHTKKEFIAELAKHTTLPVYAIDDQSALKIVDNEIEVISEGEWYKFN